MTSIKRTILDRISNSFLLLRKNFLNIVLPLFIYQLLSFIIIFKVFFLIFYNYINSSYAPKDSFFNDPIFITIIIISILIFILHLIISTLIWISVIRSIKQAFDWEKPNPIENIIYSFKNILNIIKIYWHIFAYVFLIPACVFIFWWILNICGIYSSNDIFLYIWFLMLWISILLLITFSLIRLIKTLFVISKTIDLDDYSKEGFKKSVELTKNKWWRIFWNIIAIWIFIILIWAIITIIITILWLDPYSAEKSLQIQKSILLWILDTSYANVLKSMSGIFKTLSHTSLISFLWEFMNLLINIVLWIFIYIFIYVFYKDIQKESIMKDSSNTDKNWTGFKQEKIEF